MAVLRLPYLRYVVASAMALGVDMALFLAAMRLGAAPATAAAIGYLSGIVAHWFLSSRAVFVGRLAEKGAQRRQQQGLFLGSALVGLGITTAIVAPWLAKLAAIAVSFQATYTLRRKIVFSC